MIPALFQVAFAFVITGVIALVVERPFEVQWTDRSLFAIVWLGLLGSGVAYLVFFRLLQSWGATRTSMVATSCRSWASSRAPSSSTRSWIPGPRRDGSDHRRRSARQQQVRPAPAVRPVATAARRRPADGPCLRRP
jgi:hypothetical protein